MIILRLNGLVAIYRTGLGVKLQNEYVLIKPGRFRPPYEHFNLIQNNTF